MNRKLKFRAWDSKKKKWIYETNIHPFHIIGEITVFSMLEGYSIEQYNDIMITQYTGLKDKNGKEIFEGDIINHVPKFETQYEVKYLTSGFYVCPLGENHGEYFSSLFAGFDDKLLQCNALEVVGNIFESLESKK